MIFECPKCRTTHSKPEREIGDGTEITCRKCSVAFWVTRTGVSESPPDASRKLDPFAEEETARNPVPPDDSGFHKASTEVMSVPPNVAREALEARKKAEAAAAAGNSPWEGETSMLGGEPATDAFGDEDESTRINSKEEIRDLIEQSRESSPQPEVDGGNDLDLSVPDTLGRLEGDESSDAGLDLSLSDEERPNKPRPSKPKPKPVLDGRMPVFPAEALRDWLTAMRAFLAAQKIYVKVALGVAGVLVLTLFLVVLVWIFSGSDTHVAFVDDDLTLVAGPGNHALYPQVATLERGEQVLVFDSGAVDGYVMVRDLMGRAGYLPRDNVSDYRPAARSGVPFVGCRQAPIENTPEPCVERAHVQFDSCRLICEQTGKDDMACLEQCQRQMLHCIERCEHADVESVPVAEPVLEQPVVAGPVDEEPAAKTPTKPSKKKKKKKKKKRKR